jgi:hypothetical protein
MTEKGYYACEFYYTTDTVTPMQCGMYFGCSTVVLTVFIIAALLFEIVWKVM